MPTRSYHRFNIHIILYCKGFYGYSGHTDKSTMDDLRDIISRWSHLSKDTITDEQVLESVNHVWAEYVDPMYVKTLMKDMFYSHDNVVSGSATVFKAVKCMRSHLFNSKNPRLLEATEYYLLNFNYGIKYDGKDDEIETVM